MVLSSENVEMGSCERPGMGEKGVFRAAHTYLYPIFNVFRECHPGLRA